jgi:hypothetical protein
MIIAEAAAAAAMAVGTTTIEAAAAAAAAAEVAAILAVGTLVAVVDMTIVAMEEGVADMAGAIKLRV